jgi:hypothetical protein
VSNAEEKTTLQRLVALGEKLQQMDDATLSGYILACQEFCLEAGQSNPYDPDSDPNDVDDPESEFPSFNEWEAQRLLNNAQMEWERRHRRVTVTEIHD